MPRDQPQKGKKRAYTLSAAAISQRRTAAVKHGRHRRPEAPAVAVPCRADRCPVEFPCALRQQLLARGTPVEACVLMPITVDPATRDRYLRALNGDGDALREPMAELLAGTEHLTRQAMEHLAEHGAVLEEPITGTDEDGNTELLGHRVKPNYNVDLMELGLRTLGVSATEQQITPRSRRGGDAAETLLDLADFMRQKRAAVGGGEA